MSVLQVASVREGWQVPVGLLATLALAGAVGGLPAWHVRRVAAAVSRGWPRTPTRLWAHDVMGSASTTAEEAAALLPELSRTGMFTKRHLAAARLVVLKELRGRLGAYVRRCPPSPQRRFSRDSRVVGVPEEYHR